MNSPLCLTTIFIQLNTTVDLEGDSDHEAQENTFAAKMNLLLESKCNQIEERKEMELEMQARRREREEQKRLSAAESEQAATENKSAEVEDDKESSETTNEVV